MQAIINTICALGAMCAVITIINEVAITVTHGNPPRIITAMWDWMVGLLGF